MTDMDTPGWALGRPDGQSYVLWAGPADGQPVNVSCAHDDHPDIRLPMRSHRWPHQDQTGHETQMTEVIYRWNTDTTRYEYAGTAE